MSAEVESELAPLLEPGEEVLWSGRPCYRYFRSEAWAAFVFGLITSACATVGLLISIAAVWDVLARGNVKTAPALPLPVIGACVFSAYSIRLLRTPWVCRRRLARACYAVTNRRVIVLAVPGYDPSSTVPEPSREAYQFTPAQARAYQLKPRHGRRVDLVLATERVRRSVVEVGILGAEDWEGAEGAIQTAFPG